MTCVIAAVEDGKVWMGADSCAIDNYHNYTPRRDPKIIKKHGYLIGYSYSFRMGQIIFHSMDMPEIGNHDPYELMVYDWVTCLREAFEQHGWKGTDKEGRDLGGQVLVGFNGRLFEIESDLQVGESLRNFAAIGCGSDYALGAFSVLRDSTKWKIDQKIEMSLDVSAEFNRAVTRPFTIISV